MITAQDIAITAARPAPLVAPPLRERVLLVVLFLTVLASSVAFVEPSPHDGLMGLLAVTCLIAGVRFDRLLVLPLMLLLAWNVAGMVAVTNVLSEEKTLQYTATSIYLAVAALIFASLFAHNTMPRLTAARIAYTLSAAAAALIGTAGYFHLFPGAEMFAPTGRALGAFKDPNVYGPFLIWPMLFIIGRMLTNRIAFSDLFVCGVLLFGLLLGFSRGSWFHFAVSTIVLVAIAYLTAPTAQARMRIVTLSVLSIVAISALLVLLLSFDSIGQMFQERAQLIKSYDVGEGGRFHLQELALAAILDFPNGMGPFVFARLHGEQQHNVYLQAFVVYGWAGAMAYLLLIFSTLAIGFRTAFMRTPWQAYSVTAFAAFVGEVAEGFVIDTDHWRHFFLLLGMIWGLAAATFRKPQAVHSAPIGNENLAARG